MREDQKETEERTIKTYLSLIGIGGYRLSRGETEDKDRPDFILEYGGKKIYLEHTRLMCSGGGDESARHNALSKVIEDANYVYSKRSKRQNVSAEISFCPSPNLKGSNHDRLVKALVCTVLNNQPSPDNPIVELKGEDVPENVNQLKIFIDSSDQPFFRDEELRMYGRIKKDEFQAAITPKHNKALDVNWDKYYDEAWLLLHTGESFSSFAGIDKVPSSYFLEEWIFKKIILFDSFGNSSGPKQSTYDL